MRRLLARLASPALHALLRKEFDQIKRDRRVIGALILPPILQLVLFGSVMSPDVPDLKIGILDTSHTGDSRGLVAALTESRSFVFAGNYASVDAMGRAISQGDLDAGIVIPPEFGRDIARREPTTVQVLLNAMNAQTAAVSEGWVKGVIQSYNRSLQRDGVQANIERVPGAAPRRGVALLHPAFLFNPGLVSSWFLVTGLLGQLLLMNGMITASTSMVKEREAGTIEQLLMTPSRTSEIILAKILPPFVLMGIPGGIALAVLRLYFGVPFRGSPWVLALAAAMMLMCGIGIGTTVATLTKSAQQAQLSSFFIFPPMMSLSGTLTPAEAMPAWMRPWTAINPIFHFGVISRGTLIRGSTFLELWPNLAALAVFAAVLMSVSMWRFRQQLS